MGRTRVMSVVVAARKLKPALCRFIVGLGYTPEQGKRFADGYLAKARTLPLLQKWRALGEHEDCCMTAGFKTAGIRESAAQKRLKEREQKEKEKKQKEEEKKQKEEEKK